MTISMREEAARVVPLRVVVAGATGLIGTALVNLLRQDEHDVVRLVRRDSDLQPGDSRWDPAAGIIDAGVLDGADAIVNLAGAPIDVRWTPEHRKAIVSSRVEATSLLARTAAALPHPPRVLVNASAVGYYGNRGDEELDESSPPSNDFLSRTVQAWEAATTPASEAGIRVVLTRSGVVLSPRGGALARILPLARLGLGGPLGSGKQWLSWISIVDETRAMRLALYNESLRGPVNLVAPNPVPNAEFARTLGRVLGRPALFPVPAIALEIAYGEMARDTVLASQRVRPRALLAAGFAFEHPTLDSALRAVLGRFPPAPSE